MYQWISGDTALNKLCQQLQAVELLAVDTEFIRTDTFYAKLGLLQLSDGAECWLLDIPSFQDCSELTALLSDSRRTLLFHACGEDLEVLEQSLQVRVANLYDTQVAAALANVSYSMGYARLVEALLGVELGKHETRSDWLARPLSEQQKAYAAEDVIYLHRMHAVLQQRLQALGRESWLDEEMRAVLQSAAQRTEGVDYFKRLRGAWDLPDDSLKVARRLCDWRETTARSRDIPRGRLIKDGPLLEVARRRPTKIAALYALENFHPRSIRKYGDEILQQVAAAEADPLPETAVEKPLKGDEKVMLKVLREAVEQCAGQAGLPRELLINKDELQGVARSAVAGSVSWPLRLQQGWRQDVVLPALGEVLRENSDLCQGV